jgi:hypothetical protein
VWIRHLSEEKKKLTVYYISQGKHANICRSFIATETEHIYQKAYSHAGEITGNN